MEMTSQPKIERFEGDYRFLSNFFPSPIIYNSREYKSVEHAYQAAKVLNPKEHDEIAGAFSPARAKKLARSFELRPDWDNVKVGVMTDLLVQKFSIPELREKLIATGDAILVEGNWWNDTFWGVCNGRGQNMLGRLLMEIRATVKLIVELDTFSGRKPL